MAAAPMAETVAKSSKKNPDSVKEIFKTMSYGPAPEADNVVKVSSVPLQMNDRCNILKYTYESEKVRTQNIFMIMIAIK